MNKNPNDVGDLVKEKLGDFWSLTKKAFRPKTPLNDALDEALSNKNWGSKGSTKVLIARATNDFDQFGIVMNAIFEAFKSPPSKWRLIFKAVSLCEYVVENGNERVVEHVRMRIFALKNLVNFTYKEGVMDRGEGVREKAKELVELLGDNKAIRRARNKAKKLRNKLGNISSSGDGVGNNFSRGQRDAYGDKKKSKKRSGRGASNKIGDDFSDDDGKIQIKFSSGGKSYGQTDDDDDDDDDFNPRDDSAPAEASGGEDEFDPFGENSTAPASAPAPAPATSDDGWDDFNPRSEPASAPAAADDDWADFSTAPKPAPPADDLFSIGVTNPPVPAPAPAPIDNLFSSAPAAPTSNASGDDPFGAFTSAPVSAPAAPNSTVFDTPAPAPAPASGLAVSGFGGLVSLDGLTINSAKPKAPAPAPAVRPSGNPYGAVTNAPLTGPPMGLGFPAPQYGGARPPMGPMGGYPQQQWGGYPQQQRQHPNPYGGGYPQQQQQQQRNPYALGYPQQQQPYF